jgi:hypothetical protein
VPAACDYQGKAIYLDVDMIAMTDIAQLWDQPFGKTAAMLSKVPAICVTCYRNDRMKGVLPPIDQIKSQPGLYRQLRQRILARPELITRYQGNWNCLDLRRDNGGEYANVTDKDIRILHFTKVNTQPHLRHAIPRLQKEGGKHWYLLNKGASVNPVQDHPRKDALEFFDRMLSEAQYAGFTLDKYRVEPFGDYGR